MTRTSFAQANRDREQNGKSPLSNPRNAAAGAVRHADPAEAARRQLSFFAYSWTNPLPNILKQRQAIERLSRLGLPDNPLNRLCFTSEDAVRAFQDLTGWPGALHGGIGCCPGVPGPDPHAPPPRLRIDGMVVKVDSLHQQQALGQTGHEPRWAIAWKFPPERAVTRLREIAISHGRFGRLTPVAVLQPIALAGVTISSASLHNEADLRRKDLRPGADVIIQRAGDVIPQVVGPADPERNSLMPIRCPACQETVHISPDQVDHWCRNNDCPSRLPQRLTHFVSRRAMDSDGLGSTWCHALANRGSIDNPAQLYYLQAQQLMQLPGMGSNLANRILAGIKNSRHRPLDRVLYSLNIFRLGREVSGLLANRCDSVYEVLIPTLQDLRDMEGIGPKIADSVSAGLHSPRVLRTVMPCSCKKPAYNSRNPDFPEQTTLKPK